MSRSCPNCYALVFGSSCSRCGYYVGGNVTPIVIKPTLPPIIQPPMDIRPIGLPSHVHIDGTHGNRIW